MCSFLQLLLERPIFNPFSVQISVAFAFIGERGVGLLLTTSEFIRNVAKLVVRAIKGKLVQFADPL